MCFSVAGRIQSRLVSLLVPALLTVLLTWATGDQRYFTMFMLVALLLLDLDLFLYPRMIAYQARWQTYLLGIAEFFVVLGVVRWLGGTLPLPNIIGFYVASWLGGLFILNWVLPVIDPLWAEYGGELGRPGATMQRDPGWRIEGFVARSWTRISGALVPDLVLFSLLFFLLVEETVLPSTLHPVQIIAAVAGASIVGWLAARRSDESAPTLTESISIGLLAALLVRGSGIAPYLVAGALAVAARSWLLLRHRTVFNGAALALMAVVLLVPGTYASDAQWGNSLLFPLVIANIGLFVAARSRRLATVVGFLLLLVVHALFSVHDHEFAVQFLVPEILPTYLVFFAFFVLPDPASTPNNGWVQFGMGIAVAAAGLLLQTAGIGLAFVVALLIATYAWCVVPAAIQLVGSRANRRSEPLGPQESSMHARTALITSRRSFLGALAALGGSVVLGGTLRRLTSIDPAILSLPPDAVLAGGLEIPRFDDVAARAGLVLSHHGNASEGSPAVGTGATWGDYDNDGLVDLYVTDHLGASHLYHNNGDGTFTDVSERAGVAHPTRHTTSATFVDFDNDGWLDLYVGAHGPNVLYHNNGDGTFTDVSELSGIAHTGPGRTMSTAWADYDGDGYLDVFVVNYPSEAVTFTGNSTPNENARAVQQLPTPINRLYHNNGDGTFSDVTRLLGVKETEGFGFSAVWLDYNGNGRPDLYVAYDFGWIVQPNTLWRNDGPGGSHGWKFTPVQREMGVDAGANTMGTASGDYNNDGALDLAVSNIGPNMLYRNHDGKTFRNVAGQAGVTHANDVVNNMMNNSMTWGLTFADLNNDGWLDLYLAAGTMYFDRIPQPNLLYLNDHTGRFIDVSSPSGTNDPGQGRSVAVGDFDGDGYLDMFVANYGQPPLLYRNLSRSSGNRWLRLDLEGTESNRDAVGARVTLHALGLAPQVREVQIGQGLGSSNEKTLHFGLGKTEMVNRVDIRWPSGKTQHLENISANQVVAIREPGKARWPQRRTSSEGV